MNNSFVMEFTGGHWGSNEFQEIMVLVDKLNIS